MTLAPQQCWGWSKSMKKREDALFICAEKKKSRYTERKIFFNLKKAVKEEWTGGKSAMCAKKLKSAAVTKMFF